MTIYNIQYIIYIILLYYNYMVVSKHGGILIHFNRTVPFKLKQSILGYCH